jgi:hypothetical protein
VLSVVSLSLNRAFLVSIVESIEDNEEIEKEKATAPTSIKIRQKTLSLLVTPLISPKPTVVKVASTKYIEAI